MDSSTLSLQKLQNTKDGTRLQRPQCASTQTRGEREFAIDYNVIGLHWKLTVFNSQAKKKGITWIKPSYLRKIDFVAVLESADSLAEAGSQLGTMSIRDVLLRWTVDVVPLGDFWHDYFEAEGVT